MRRGDAVPRYGLRVAFIVAGVWLFVDIGLFAATEFGRTDLTMTEVFRFVVLSIVIGSIKFALLHVFVIKPINYERGQTHGSRK